jgi:pimeloyl-ACP methyl ester carboxylesterase
MTTERTTPPATRRLARPGQSSSAHHGTAVECRIAYDVQGRGPLVVLVPGIGDLRSTYRFTVPHLIAAGYTVVTTDLRGHGDSDATFAEYGSEVTAGDIAALIRELGEPATIIGNSMAAGSAVIVAAEHPELVTGLVLVGPFVRNPKNSAFALAFFRLLMARPWAAAAWSAYLPTLYAGTKPRDFAEYRKAITAALKRPGHTRAFSLTTRVNHARAEASIAAVTAPTLVIMGEKDPDFSDPQGEAQWIAGAFSGSAIMIPDAGHYPHSQQPDQVASAIQKFLMEVTHRA